tara:strand:- start:5586 stop:7505 length:1920 start_codon:yes stop_codon:yes gene_type:complete
MIKTDYHEQKAYDIFDKQQNSIISMNTQEFSNSSEKIKLNIFCVDNRRKKVRKFFKKEFGKDSNVKFNLYLIPKCEIENPFSKSFPCMNSLFEKFHKFQDNKKLEKMKKHTLFKYYTKFLENGSKNNHALFIFDFNIWKKQYQKNPSQLIQILNLPYFWDIINLNLQSLSANTQGIHIPDIMSKNQALMRHDDLDWCGSILINKNCIKNILKKLDFDLEENNVFSLQKISNDVERLEFQESQYRNLNFDLCRMTSHEATTHFLLHGWMREKRYFWYPPHLEEPRIILNNKKKCLVLLNHSETLTGAPFVIYQLFLFLKRNNVNVFLFTPKINKNLLEKLELKDLSSIVEFHHNPVFLERCLKLLNPYHIVVNSFSSEFVYLHTYLNNLLENTESQVTQYVHEDYSHYIPNQLNLKLARSKILCADHRTMRTFKDKEVEDKSIQLLSPKFLKSQLVHKKENLKPIYSLLDLSYLFKFISKPIIGMIGTPCERKNFELFQKLAAYSSEYEFIWVGGDETYNKNNLTVIAQTPHVLSILNKFQCFILTSNVDLCPVVLLESLYLNVPSLIFQKNIGFKHKKCKHLNIVKDDINNLTCSSITKLIQHTMNYPNHPDTEKYPKGEEYIKSHFVYEKKHLELFTK